MYRQTAFALQARAGTLLGCGDEEMRVGLVAHMHSAPCGHTACVTSGRV